MKISRDSDGLRFLAECSPDAGFLPEDIHCVRCGRRVAALSQSEVVLLRCSACNFTGRVFWSEADLAVYVAEQWDHLRKACSHPAVATA